MGAHQKIIAAFIMCWHSAELSIRQRLSKEWQGWQTQNCFLLLPWELGTEAEMESGHMAFFRQGGEVPPSQQWWCFPSPQCSSSDIWPVRCRPFWQNAFRSFELLWMAVLVVSEKPHYFTSNQLQISVKWLGISLKFMFSQYFRKWLDSWETV